MATLADGPAPTGKAAIQAELDAASAALDDRLRARRRARRRGARSVRPRLDEADFSRGDYARARAAQDAALDLPVLPTTTIGSFPQTGEIRKARARSGEGRDRPRAVRTRSMSSGDPPRRRAAGGDRPRRARARRARAQRHGAVLRREPRRVRRDAERLGAVLRLALRPVPSILWGDVSRPAPITVELVDLHAEPHREAGQGHADRPGHDPRVVVRARRPAAAATPPTRSPSRCATRSPTSRRPASASSRSTSPRCASCCR